MRRRPEFVAAAVNGFVTLLLPGIPVILSMLFPARSPTSVTVRPADASRVHDLVEVLFAFGPVMLPLAAIAAWRTWVHAVSWREHGTRGWQGVAEGGALGLLIALLVLAVPTIMRPKDAPPYLMVYGGLSLLVGLAVGFLLRSTAAVVMRMLGSSPAPRP